MSLIDIDWITISQSHKDKQNQLPRVNSGVVLSLNDFEDLSDQYHDDLENAANDDFYHSIDNDRIKFKDGLMPQWMVYKKVVHRGSFETSLLLACDGTTVFLSGNVGRFGRPDNVFNLDFHQTIRKANKILKEYGLPPFTFGKTSHYFDTTKSSKSKLVRNRESGAIISRLDVNCNYATGSQANSRAAIKALKRRGMSNVKQGSRGDSTVFWGSRGGRLFTRAYIKHLEMMAHSKGQIAKNNTENSKSYEFCRNNGIVRIEVVVDRKTLLETGLIDIEKVTMATLKNIYDKKVNQLINPPKFSVDRLDVALFPRTFRRTLALWLSGVDIRDTNNLSLSTYYRHRKALLDYGVDISIDFEVETKESSYPMIEKVGFFEASRPSWYSLQPDSLMSVAKNNSQVLKFA